MRYNLWVTLDKCVSKDLYCVKGYMRMESKVKKCETGAGGGGTIWEWKGDATPPVKHPPPIYWPSSICILSKWCRRPSNVWPHYAIKHENQNHLQLYIEIEGGQSGISWGFNFIHVYTICGDSCFHILLTIKPAHSHSFKESNPEKSDTTHCVGIKDLKDVHPTLFNQANIQKQIRKDVRYVFNCQLRLN